MPSRTLHGYAEGDYIWVPSTLESKSHIGDLSNSLPAHNGEKCGIWATKGKGQDKHSIRRYAYLKLKANPTDAL
jgi:hypothetical protein